MLSVHQSTRIRSPWLAWSALLIAALPGCQGDLETIELSQAGDAVIVVVTLDAMDRPLRIMPAFGVKDGALDFGVRPQFGLQGDEVGAGWLRLPKPVIEQAYPGAWSLRHLVTVQIQPPPASPQSRATPDNDAWEWTDALPADVEVTGAAAQTLLNALSLNITQPGEPCTSRRRMPLVPFAASARPMPRGPGQDLEGLVVLDRDTVLIAGKDIAVVRRSQTVDPGVPDQVLSRDTIFEGEDAGGLRVEDLQLDPTTAGQPRQRIYAVVNKSFMRSAIIEMSYEAGALRFVRTATIAPVYLKSLAVSDAGWVAATGDPGSVIISRDGAQTFVRQDPPGTGPTGFRTRKIVFKPGAEAPLLLANVDRIFSLDPQALSWQPQQVLPIDTNMTIEDMDADAEQVWLGGTRGAVVHQAPGQGFVQVPLRFSPLAGACAEPHETRAQWSIIQEMSAVTINDPGALVAFRYCAALFEVEPATGCVRTILNAGSSAVVSPASIQEIAVIGDQVIVADDDGGLFISEGYLP